MPSPPDSRRTAVCFCRRRCRSSRRRTSSGSRASATPNCASSFCGASRRTFRRTRCAGSSRNPTRPSPIRASHRSSRWGKIATCSSFSTGRRWRLRILPSSSSAISTATNARCGARRSTSSAPPPATRAQPRSTGCSASRARRSLSSTPTGAYRRSKSGRWRARARRTSSRSRWTARSTTRKRR